MTFIRCHFVALCLLMIFGQLDVSRAVEVHVSLQGKDEHDGSAARPVATLEAAKTLTRKAGGGTVILHAGTYRLSRPLELSSLDSGTEFRAATNEDVRVTSDLKLDLKWKPFRDGIWQADLGSQWRPEKTPATETQTQSKRAIDQLFVNGQPRRMARYPNFDAAIRHFGGFAADATSRERAARWSQPAGAYLHALHPGAWGGVHFLIQGKDANGDLKLAGGWQNNRGSGMHKLHRYVEHIFEELDAPDEWFHDTTTNTLYFFPPEGLNLNSAVVDVPTHYRLVMVNGVPDRPAKNVTLRGIKFQHAARSFMATRQPLLRSDWKIAAEAAVFFEGTEDCGLVDCDFEQVGGNAVFFHRYNRRGFVRGCDLRNSGASSVAFVGNHEAVHNPLFEYGERQGVNDISREAGPASNDYPKDCVVEDCLIRGIGLVEKQAAGVQIAMASGITVRNCSIYDASRAGINIGDGCWGGHRIEHCDVFDTVQETGDHGSFNSWGRDRYWGLKEVRSEELPALAKLDAVQPTVLHHNRWRCDHGWDVDLDDGSSNYEITNNVFLRGGLKLREGFHRVVRNNIGVGCGFHPHVWYHIKGDGISNDEVTRNIWAGAHAPAIMPSGKWGREVDFNLFTTSDADRLKFAANGCDAHSLTGDPLFINRDAGDYRVKEGSPALKLGFVNFSMDDFGVKSTRLKKLARTPTLPSGIGFQPVRNQTSNKNDRQNAYPTKAVEHYWLGATVRGITGDEFSAFGVTKESGGVHFKVVPTDSLAAKSGFKSNDLLQALNDQPVKTLADLWRVRDKQAGSPLQAQFVREQAPQRLVIENYAYARTERAASETFQTIPLRRSKDVLPILALTSQPATSNEPLKALFDGKLAQNYGPVFDNGVDGGLYKVDLGQRREVREINSFSFHQNGNRGPQRFILFGSVSDTDPGWNVTDSKLFVPIIEVDSTAAPAEPFQATSIRFTKDTELGSYRWLIWKTHAVTAIGENTAFQELQVVGAP